MASRGNLCLCPRGRILGPCESEVLVHSEFEMCARESKHVQQEEAQSRGTGRKDLELSSRDEEGQSGTGG